MFFGGGMQFDKDIKLLIVEDEPDLREVYSLTLLKKGFLVEHADCGSEAVHEVNNGSYDLIITDLMMSRGNGLLVIEAAMKKKIPILVLTAYADAEITVAVPKGVPVLRKPCDLDHLVEAIVEQVSEMPVSA